MKLDAKSKYAIVPATFKPNTEGSFVVTVFSDVDVKLRQLKDPSQISLEVCGVGEGEQQTGNDATSLSRPEREGEEEGRGERGYCEKERAGGGKGVGEKRIAAHELQGEWTGSGAGGNLDHSSWRCNAQYLLFLEQKAQVKVSLEPLSAEPPPVGLYLAANPGMHYAAPFADDPHVRKHTPRGTE